jgi:hypothetical protein
MPDEDIEVLKKKVASLELDKQKYEQNGAAKLYYALNRKMNEMADLLNSTNLKNIALDDPKDKTFDRLKIVWNDAASIAGAVQVLGNSIGITGDEDKDVKRRRTTPESIAEDLGENKRQDV